METKVSQNYSESHTEEHEAIAAAVSDLDVTFFLTQPRQLAIKTLQDFEDTKVLDLVSAIRLPSHIHHTFLQGLSCDQINALLSLQHCPDGHILVWLARSRGAGSHSESPDTSGHPTLHNEPTNGFGSNRRRPLRTKIQPSSIIPDRFPSFGGQNIQNLTRESRDRRHCLGNKQQPLSTQAVDSPETAGEQPWRCVNMFCKKHCNRFVYETCDGWKRHMKEHETIWPCMPYGSLEKTDHGLVCVLCGSLNPTESHMTSHSIGSCGDTTVKLRGVSRRSNLEKHLLRSHAVPKYRIRSLANMWKTTARKKYFSCGFCVCIFSTIHEQLNHIDTNHFKKGQPITQWSATKVIQGLLLSPEVASSFQSKLYTNPYSSDRELHWDSHAIEGLQRRLEIAEEPGETLALAAYTMLNSNLSRHNPNEQQPLKSPSDLTYNDQNEVASGPFDVPVEGLENKSTHQFEEPCPGSAYPWYPDEDIVAAQGSSASKPNFNSPTNQSDTSEADHSMICPSPDPMGTRGIPNIGASSGPRSQLIYAPSQTGSTSSVSELSYTSAYDSPTMSPQLQTIASDTYSILHWEEAAGVLRGQANAYEKPTPNTRPLSELDTQVSPSSLDGDLCPLVTCDPKDLIRM